MKVYSVASSLASHFSATSGSIVGLQVSVKSKSVRPSNSAVVTCDSSRVCTAPGSKLVLSPAEESCA
ncbi:MAG: hypothetical protein V9E99_17520 [Microthrixaceae bacterium]